MIRHNPSHGLAALWRSRAGAQAVEFALTIPITLLLILGGMDFGRLMWTLSALHLSCEQAARCWAQSICASSSATATFATTVVPQLNLATSVFTATSGASASCYVAGVGGYQVTASYAFQFIPTTLFPNGPTLSATACIA